MKNIDMKSAIKKALKTAERGRYGEKCLAELKKCKTPNDIDRCLTMGLARKEAVSTATDLFYPEKVITKIWQANTEREITNILIDARKSA